MSRTVLRSAILSSLIVGGIPALSADSTAAQDQAQTRDLRAAQAGDAEAQFRVGWRLLTTEFNLKLAAEWLAKAAGQGLAVAQFHLASMYASGTGVPADDLKAVELFRRASEQGYRDAMVSLGAFLLQGRGPIIDVATFQITDIERLRAASGQSITFTGTVARVERVPTSGTSKSYNLYIYFTGGDDVRVRAIPWAADQVDAKYGRDDLIGKTISVTVPRLYAAKTGQIEIGITRIDEIRVAGARDRPEIDRRRARATASRPEAMKWLSAAAKLGSTRAYTWMGLAYTHDYVEAYDYFEAASWFRQGAQRGDDYARVLLADLFVEGRGVSESLPHARPLYAEAARSNDPFIAERARNGLKRVDARQPGVGRADWALIALAAFVTYAILASDSGSSADASTGSNPAGRRDDTERMMCIVRGGIWTGLACITPPPPCRTSLGLPC